MLRRRPARSSLLDFTEFTFPQYKADPVHQLIAAALDEVVEGKTDRLMIFAPPQHGKSELASVRFPAYWLGRRPNDPIIVTSYGASLAITKSRAARDIIEGENFAKLFPKVKTRSDSRAADNWRLAYPNRAQVVAAGVGGPITGNPAMLGIIDDPFENWAAAQSETVRNHVWDWFRGTFRTRIWEGGAIVLIMTRWHEDDLAGRLMKDQPGRWKILRLPAIAESQAERDENDKYLGLQTGEPDPLGREAGEPLAPQRFSREYMLETKTDVGSLVWAAEYQGVPRPLEGSTFKRGWFKIVGVAPRKARRVRYWDNAGTEGAGAYSCGTLVAYSGGIFYVEDVVRGQWSRHERRKQQWITAVLDAIRYGNLEIISGDPDDPENFEYVVHDPGPRIYIEQEPGSGGKDAVLDDIAGLAGFGVHRDRPQGNKEVRATIVSAQAEAGNVCLVRGAWNWEYLNEFAAFPNSTYKDQVDSTSGAFARLAGKLQQKIYHGSVR